MRSTTIILILVLHAMRESHCSDILVATMAQGKSHAGSMVPLLDELARQGHNVTIYMEQYGDALKFGNDIKQWYINITGHPTPFFNDFANLKQMWRANYRPMSMRFGFNFSIISCGYVMAEYRDEFLRISQYPWDLILTDSVFSPCGYGITLLAHAKHVIMHTTSVEPAQGLAKGYARHYVTSPPFYMPANDVRYEVGKFRDRLFVAFEWLLLWWITAIDANSHVRQTLAPVVPDFDIILFNKLSSMSFTDMPLQLSLPESRTNELFSYGAYCKQSGRLTGELANFVADPRSRGTIVLAFGTLLKWNGAPKERREAFFQALNKLPDYRIIWSCHECSPMKVGSHIRLLRWLPQKELLNHPRTKLFITHGGLKSLKEAVCAKMPTLFMPMFAEQGRNAWLAKHHGFGQVINKLNVTADYLLGLIQDMLTNPSYKRMAEKIRGYFEDAPIPPIQEGAFRIKRLIKYGGRMPEYFYTRCSNFTYLRYLNLDLILLIPAIIYSLLLIK